ncbi:MAG TPA: carboxypeptidase-like regulatory domain-containing protein, partial [Blastocatellia bacterium]|nr:carboxypeptidase-like regulatory domain-containing protein [Blastocatellia bacterium]
MLRRLSRPIKQALVGMLSILLMSTTVPAQGASSVRGTVLDPQGKAIAGATVSLISAETNAVR